MTTTPDIWLGITDVNDPANESGNQTEPRITELSDGRILVSWRDDGDNYDSRNGADFVGQLFEMDGTPIGQPMLLNTVWHGGLEVGHDIAALEDGGWIIVYEDINTSTRSIRSERFDADGNMISSSTVATGTDSGDNYVRDPSIETNAEGDRVIVFSREDGNGTDTRGVVIEVNGNTTTFHPEDDYGSRSEEGFGVGAANDTAILSNGDIVTVNEDYASVPNSTRVNVRVCDPDGTVVTSFLTQTSANPWDWTNPTVEALVGGGFVVTYLAGNNNSSDYGIRVAIYNNAGQTVASPFYAAFDNNQSGSSLRHSFADAAALDDGGFIVGWYQTADLHFQRYDGAGNTVGNELVITGAQPGFGSGSRFEEFELTSTQDGRVMVTWVDENILGADQIGFLILDPRDDGITITGTNGVDGLSTPDGGGTVNALGGADTVIGRGGDDTFIDTDLTSGDHYNGRLVIDTIDYSNVTFGGTTNINLQLGTVTNTFSGLTDTLENIENVIGSQGGETIHTVSSTTYVDAQGGNDRVIVTEVNMDGDYYRGGTGTDWFDISSILFFTAVDIEHLLNIDIFRAGVASGGEALVGFENIDGANNIGNSVETFVGTSGNNVFHGNGGMDYFRGNGGADQIFGGSGADTFEVASAHLVSGVRYDGGSQTDTMKLISTGYYDFRGLGSNVVSNIEIFDLTSPLSQTVYLQFDSNVFSSGNIGAATFIGGNGNEQLQVFSVGSTIDLSALSFTNWDHNFDEEVIINGGIGAETITGSVLDDEIRGGNGNDIIDGGAGGNDFLDGEGGSDTVSYASAMSAVQVDLRLQGQYQATGGGGNDFLTSFNQLTGSDYGDTLIGNDFWDILRGGDGNDTLDSLGNSSTASEEVYGGNGNDTITRNYHANIGMQLDGGAHIDTLVAPDLTFGDLVDFEEGFIWENGVKWDSISNFENYSGTAGEDFRGDGNNNSVIFSALNYANTIDGGGGDDTVSAGGGADIIIGGKGIDELKGEAGNDRFIVNQDELGNGELMDGGDDTDTLEVRGMGTFDLRQASLNAIEILEFGENYGQIRVIMSDTQIAAFSGIDANTQDDSFLEIYMENQDIDLSGLSFQDWVSGSDEVAIWGNSQNNTIIGTRYADDIRAGSGLGDTVDYSGSSAAVNVSIAGVVGTGSGGDAEGDRLREVENLTGSNHDDTLEGNDGWNRLEGGGGNDLLIGGAGADDLVGGQGVDTASYAAAASGVTVDLAAGTGSEGDALGDTFDSIENVTGSAHGDSLTGNQFDNRLLGLAGKDFLFGDVGDDTLEGGEGSDLLIGGAGADVLDGGDDSDTASYQGSAAGVIVDLSTGAAAGGDAQGDTLMSIENLTGSGLDDTLTGDALDNQLSGGGGNDTLSGGDGEDLLVGGAGADALDGGGDIDTASYAGSSAAVTVDLRAGAVGSGGDAQGDSWASIENATGSSHADTLIGNIFNNRLSGRNGTDTLLGYAGNDMLEGDAGDDLLIGGAGADTLDGGADTDTASYAGSAAAVTVHLGTGTASGGDAQGDTFISIENLTGSDHDDSLSGDGFNNRLEGGSGADTLAGLDGDDELAGGNGFDHLIGGAGADELNGGAGIDLASYLLSLSGVTVDIRAAATGIGGDAQGDTYVSIENVTGSNFADTITGNIFNSRLVGRNGDDTLAGLAGNDSLNGGLGVDTFVYANGRGHDTIEDFDATNGDIIDLSGLSAFNAFADLTAPGVMTQTGSDVLITFSAAESILLRNVQLADLDASDFDF